MLAYLLLAGNEAAPVDPDLIARFDQDDPPEVPFHPESRIVWRNANDSVVFFGWQAFTDVAGIGSHWAVDDQGLTAFTGHCWPRETGWVHGANRSWAAQLRSYLRDQPNPLAARESWFRCVSPLFRCQPPVTVGLFPTGPVSISFSSPMDRRARPSPTGPDSAPGRFDQKTPFPPAP